MEYNVKPVWCNILDKSLQSSEMNLSAVTSDNIESAEDNSEFLNAISHINVPYNPEAIKNEKELVSGHHFCEQVKFFFCL